MSDYNYEDETRNYVRLSISDDTCNNSVSAVELAEQQHDALDDVFESDYIPPNRKAGDNSYYR